MFTFQYNSYIIHTQIFFFFNNTVKAAFIDIPGDPKICRYIRLSLHMMKAWLILNYANLIEYVLVLSNIKYMLSLISIISLIVYIKLILLMRATSIT